MLLFLITWPIMLAHIMLDYSAIMLNIRALNIKKKLHIVPLQYNY